MSVQSKADFDYALIIKTNSYTGNFERELCGYVTGVTGECGVGEEAAEVFMEETDEVLHGISESTAQISDDKGCYRPAALWYMDSNDDTEMAIFFQEPMGDEELAYISSRIRAFPSYSAGQEYGQKGLVIESIKFIKRELKVTDTVLNVL